MPNQAIQNVFQNEEERQRALEEARFLRAASRAGIAAKLLFFLCFLLTGFFYFTFFWSAFGDELKGRYRVVAGVLPLTEISSQRVLNLRPGATFAIHDSTQFIYVVNSGEVRGTITRREAQATSKKDYAWQHAVYAVLGLIVACGIVAVTFSMRSGTYYKAAAKLKKSDPVVPG